jgi:hypothetical protein
MSKISLEEQERRAEAARQFSHSTRMSGGRVPPSAEASIAAYVRGEIDEAEMRRRARADYGLPAEHNTSECPASGQSVGRMVEIPGSDEWKITCPECGAWWHGGGVLLPKH